MMHAVHVPLLCSHPLSPWDLGICSEYTVRSTVQAATVTRTAESGGAVRDGAAGQSAVLPGAVARVTACGGAHGSLFARCGGCGRHCAVRQAPGVRFDPAAGSNPPYRARRPRRTLKDSGGGGRISRDSTLPPQPPRFERLATLRGVIFSKTLIESVGERIFTDSLCQ